MTNPHRPRNSPLRPYWQAVADLPRERFLEIGDQTLHVTDSGKGKPLLLLHGLAASSYSFREIIPRLAPDHRVVTVDLNGFGLTERPRDPAHFRIEHQADLIARVLDRLGIGTTDLLGHSYGAAVAATLAKQHPRRCGRLVFVSPAASFDPLPWYLRIAPGRELFYRLVLRLLSNPERYRRVAGRAFHVEGVFSESVAEVYRSHLLVEGLRETWSGFLQAMMDPRFPGSSYDGLEHPVLILAGEMDRIVPSGKCEALAGRLPQAQLEVIPGCGHSAPEERPDEVAAAVRRFLATEHHFD